METIHERKGDDMKRNTIARTFTIALTAVALGIVPTAKADDKGCSSATLTGTFGFISSGFRTAPSSLAGPIAQVGTQTFDGYGGTTATATFNQNGNTLKVTITGTYAVNADC